jgi:hypothetical protein
MDKKIIDIKRDTIQYLEWSVETSVDYHASCICYTLENYFDILGRVFLDELFLSWFITSYFNEDIHMITHEIFEKRFILRKNDFIEDRKGKKNNNGIIDLKNIEDIYIDTMYEFPNEKIDQNINSSDVFTFDKLHYPIAQTAGRSSNTRSKHMKNRMRTTYKKKRDERV